MNKLQEQWGKLSPDAIRMYSVGKRLSRSGEFILSTEVSGIGYSGEPLYGRRWINKPNEVNMQTIKISGDGWNCTYEMRSLSVNSGITTLVVGNLIDSYNIAPLRAENAALVKQQSESNDKIGQLQKHVAGLQDDLAKAAYAAKRHEGKLEDLRKEADRLRGVGDQALKRADEWAARFRWLQAHCNYVVPFSGGHAIDATEDGFEKKVDDYIERQKLTGQTKATAHFVTTAEWSKNPRDDSVTFGVDMAAAGTDSTVHAQVQSKKVLETFTELPQIWRASKEFYRPLTGAHFNQLANSINCLARMIGRLQK